MSHNKIKLKLFKNFSKLMKEKKVSWIVIGGLNDFPNKIGRDLDIIIKDQNKIKLVKKIFLNCLKKIGIKKIISKTDYYGTLLIAFDGNFNYYELHICNNKIRSIFFSVKPNWKRLIRYEYYFVDPICYIFKNYFSANNYNIKFLNYKLFKKPLWLNVYLYYKFRGKIYFLNFFAVSLIYILTNPFNFLINIIEFFKNKILQMKYKHANIFYIPDNFIRKKVFFLVRKFYIKKYFIDIKDLNDDFFIKYIYFKKNKKNIILNLLLFFKIFKKSFLNSQNSFLYTSTKPKNISYELINTTNDKIILQKIASAINIKI